MEALFISTSLHPGGLRVLKSTFVAPSSLADRQGVTLDGPALSTLYPERGSLFKILWVRHVVSYRHKISPLLSSHGLHPLHPPRRFDPHSLRRRVYPFQQPDLARSRLHQRAVVSARGWCRLRPFAVRRRAAPRRQGRRRGATGVGTAGGRQPELQNAAGAWGTRKFEGDIRRRPEVDPPFALTQSPYQTLTPVLFHSCLQSLVFTPPSLLAQPPPLGRPFVSCLTGATPLVLAALHGRAAVIPALILAGAAPDGRSEARRICIFFCIFFLLLF